MILFEVDSIVLEETSSPEQPRRIQNRKERYHNRVFVGVFHKPQCHGVIVAESGITRDPEEWMLGAVSCIQPKLLGQRRITDAFRSTGVNQTPDLDTLSVLWVRQHNINQRLSVSSSFPPDRRRVVVAKLQTVWGASDPTVEGTR